MKKDEPQYVDIPQEELGEGCIVDFENNRIIGVSGRIYENVLVNKEDIGRLIEKLKRDRVKH